MRRLTGATAGGLALLGWLAGAVAHLSAPTSVPVVAVASLSWLVVWAAPLAVLAFAVARLRVGVIVAAVCSCWLFVYAPLFVGARPAGTAQVAILSVNLRYGQADAGAVVAAVRRDKVQILSVQELTRGARARLRAAGLDELLPHAQLRPADSAAGLGIWSAMPIAPTASVSRSQPELISVLAQLAGGRRLTVVCAHPEAPYPGPASQWTVAAERLHDVLAALPRAQPVAVAGDLNSTWDNARFRSLLSGGYADGADQAGAGIVRTWPADRAFPPLIGIDHVLTRDAVVTHLRTVSVPGTDHLGLLARVSLG